MKRKFFAVSVAVLLLLAASEWRGAKSQGKDEKTEVSFDNSMRRVLAAPPASVTNVNSVAERRAKPKVVRLDARSSRWRERASEYEPVIHRAAHAHGVDPRLLWTLAFLETRFRPELISPKGARGLMQFMPQTARRYGLTNPHHPADSVDAAARYVRDLTLRFGHRFDLILASYNAGEGTVDAYLKGYPLKLSDGRIINPRGLKLGGIPPYAETRNYVSLGLTILRRLSVGGAFEIKTRRASSWSGVRSRKVTAITRPPASRLNTLPTSLYAATPTITSTSVYPARHKITESKIRSFRIAAAPVSSH